MALDPFTTVVRLALINYKTGAVKLGIMPTGLTLFDDTWLDRGRRTLQHWLGNGCSREFLFTLRPALEQAVAMYRAEYPMLFEWAYSGLERVKTTYACSNVAETIALAMRTLRDPAQPQAVQPTWNSADINAVMILLQLLQADPAKKHLMECIDVLLNGNKPIVSTEPEDQKI